MVPGGILSEPRGKTSIETSILFCGGILFAGAQRHGAGGYPSR